MSKVLLINPSKWGRGITPIWIASHSAVLKSKGHKVKLFDCTFYENWTVNENKFNTENKQYKSSEYFDYITYNKKDVL
jgi:anaerobic magnesium-protoporphyrin IX monomethyl ester cyclase